MNIGVPPSDLGAQPIGDISLIVEGTYQLKLPVPFPLKFVASYLVEGRDGWTVIDPGFDYSPARDAWEAGATSSTANASPPPGGAIATVMRSLRYDQTKQAALAGGLGRAGGVAK